MMTTTRTESAMARFAFGIITNGPGCHVKTFAFFRPCWPTLPMVTIFPRFLSTGTSVLGLGDVLVPGLFLAFLRRVDVDMHGASMRRFFRGYFFVGMTAYMCGIVLTFVIATLFKSGQPALLYLIPIVHITTVITARWRGQLRHIWSDSIQSESDTADDSMRESLTTTATDTTDENIESLRLFRCLFRCVFSRFNLLL